MDTANTKKRPKRNHTRKPGKQTVKGRELMELGKAYDLAEACSLLKQAAFAKFNESIEMHVRLGVDPRQANQMVRGVATLPHGTGKTVRVLVLTTPEKEEAAREAGADHVGLEIGRASCRERV
jgi:large subunit ribosomal protein L1